MSGTMLHVVSNIAQRSREALLFLLEMKSLRLNNLPRVTQQISDRTGI